MSLKQSLSELLLRDFMLNKLSAFGLQIIKLFQEKTGTYSSFLRTFELNFLIVFIIYLYDAL